MLDFWLCFVPLFIAVDIIGVVPMFMGIIEGVEEQKKHRIIIQSVITAMAVSLAFLFVGQVIFNILGITIADFMVAGGILLFLLAISDLLAREKKQRYVDYEDVGAVPLGVPLITGPAVLTTVFLLANEFGYAYTVAATVANILIAGVAFWFSGVLLRILGKAGARILSKLSNLLMAAIGVMIVRKGIVKLIEMAMNG